MKVDGRAETHRGQSDCVSIFILPLVLWDSGNLYKKHQFMLIDRIRVARGLTQRGAESR